MATNHRIDNFNPGPAVLPDAVLTAAQQELLDYKGSGMSVLEISHRSALYTHIQEDAETRLRRLLQIPEDFEVLFLQGGASLQFAMIPMNFVGEGQTAAYVLTGSWSEKALQEAERVTAVRVAATTKDNGYKSLPMSFDTAASDAYVHITSNNTIYGTQWRDFPRQGPIPLVADMSSDILSRPFAVDQFHLIYAGAQKNLGPAGVTLVIVKRDWLSQVEVSGLPKMLTYSTHVKAESKYNTPPVFAVYILGKVLEWLEAEGGLTAVSRRNAMKAGLLYDAMDTSGGFYNGYVDRSSRSRMNVTFHLPTPELEAQFLKEAEEAGFVGLGGHRSVGGCRASIYNALSVDACERLSQFMEDFRRRA